MKDSLRRLARTLTSVGPNSKTHKRSGHPARTRLSLGALEERAVPASFSNFDGITIPASGTGPGVSDPQYSYINVSSFPSGTTVNYAQVELRNLTHTYPDDLDVYFGSVATGHVLLMSDAGGADNVSGVTLVFVPNNSSSASLPDSSQISSGTYRGTNYNTEEGVGFPTDLGSFSGVSPNQAWRIDIRDDASADSGSLQGWFLSLLTAPYNVSAGGSYSTSEGNGVSLSASASDADGHTLSYSWDLNNDGNFGDVSGRNPVVSWSTLQTYGINDNGSFPIRVRVSDGYSSVTSPSTILSVSNTVPTATLGNSGSVIEGTTGFVSFSNRTDPSSADTAMGLHYAYDFDNNGTFDSGNGTYGGSGTSASATVPASFLADGPGTRTVRGRIIDKDGGFTDYTTAIGVINVAPTATFTNGGPVNEGSTGSVSFSGQFDRSTADYAFRYSYDFNNDGVWEVGTGTYAGSSGTSPSSTIPASYLANGPASRTVRGRIIDKDGGFTDYTTSIIINNVAPTFEAGADAALPPPALGSFTRAGIQITDPGSPETYTGTVNFGDGTGNQPLVIDQATRRFNLAHTYTAEGTFTVTATVSDGQGGISADAFKVVVALNTPPAVASDVAAVTVDEGGSATNTGTFSDSQGTGTVVLSASVGQVIQNNAAGTWSWTLAAADGPAGPTTVTITATDNYGAAATTTFTYGVSNVAPTISLSGAATVAEGSPYTLNLGPVSDPGQDSITSYTIDWGDGTVDPFSGDPANTTALHTYADGPDNRTYEVKVTDEDGTFLAGTLNVQVLNVAPLIALTGAASVSEGSSYTLNLGAVSDPGQDTVTAYSIDWGDGTVDHGTGNPANTTAAHVYEDGPASHTISVSLTDEDGDYSNAGTLPVVVHNAAPGLTVGQTTVTVNEGQTATNSGTWSDPGQDVVTLTASVGTVSKNTGGTWSWHLATDDGPAGPQTVTITATDSDGDSMAVDFSLTVDSVAPTAVFGAPATGSEGAPFTVSLTAPSDPSAADSAAGFTYAFDFGSGYGTFGTSNTADFTPQDNGIYAVKGRVQDKDGGVREYTATVTVTNVAPTANAGDDQTVNEGTTVSLSGTFTDPGSADTHTQAWSVAASNGQVIAGGTGPDYSFVPNDNGTYTVTYSVTDDDGGVDTDTLAVTVANVAPTPAIDSIGAVRVEGTAITVGGSATDPAGTNDSLTYAWAVYKDGAAAPAFTGGGAGLSFTPADNGSYRVALTASDEDGGSTTVDQTITVSNADPVATITGAPATSPEGTAINLGSTVTDAGSADTHTYSWSVTKNGVAYGSGGSGSAYAFTPADNGTYAATLTVTDDDGGSHTVTETVTVANVAPTLLTLGATSVGENGTVTLTGTYADAGTQDTHTLTINWGEGAPVTVPVSGGSFSVTHQYLDDNPTNSASDVYTIGATLTDDDTASATASTTTTVTNAAPTVALTGPSGSQFAKGAPVTFTGTYADVGSADTHTATLTFTPASGAAVSTTAAVTGGVISIPYTFTAAGVYEVTLRVTDDDGDSGVTSTLAAPGGVGPEMSALVVVYDASAGFVTGGGWIDSPAGAYTADPSLTGRAQFAFVSQYKAGTSVPDGNTQFMFKAAGFDFRSTGYDWLVVAGARAQYKGVGTVNGVAGYRFMLTAVDGQQNGGGGADRFRIKIWTDAGIVYDNVPDAVDNVDGTSLTGLGGGSIQIHDNR